MMRYLRAVIPGRREAASPESISTTRGCGFRAPRCARPRNDDRTSSAVLGRQLSIFLLVAATLCVGATPLAAQSYPSRPVKVILNVGPGGTGDIFIRTIGEELHKRWGQPIVVENRPGGGFIVAGRAWRKRHPTAIRSAC
jgi:hypothetical protein